MLVPVKRGVLKLVGKDGSGKTNLKRSLKREMFNPKHTSTEAIEIEVLHREYYRKEWMPIKKGQLQRMVVGAIEQTAANRVGNNIYF